LQRSALPLGDDEVLATVSLDLMQKADQIYLQGNTLLEPSATSSNNMPRHDEALARDAPMSQ